MVQARRHGWLLAVLFFDIDDFKSINDTHGHQVGDEVLLMIAERLQSFVRLAQRMIESIAEDCVTSRTTLSVRCSVGIATYPGGGDSADALLKNADEAMYRAKGTSDRVVLYS